MKKLVLSLAMVATVTFAFGQKKVVKEAEKGFKSGNLVAALTAIDAATTNPETSGHKSTASNTPSPSESTETALTEFSARTA